MTDAPSAVRAAMERMGQRRQAAVGMRHNVHRPANAFENFVQHFRLLGGRWINGWPALCGRTVAKQSCRHEAIFFTELFYDRPPTSPGSETARHKQKCRPLTLLGVFDV